MAPLLVIAKALFVSKATELAKEGLDMATKSGDESSIKTFSRMIDKNVLHSKRAWSTVIGVLVVMFNRKLGLDLGVEEIGAITAMVISYVTWKTVEQKA